MIPTSAQEDTCVPNVRGSSLKVLSAVAVFVLLISSASAQSVQVLKHQPPDDAQLTFQLTDGTVLAQGYGDSDWWKLTPDNTGSYVNGTWTQVPACPRDILRRRSLRLCWQMAACSSRVVNTTS